MKTKYVIGVLMALSLVTLFTLKSVQESRASAEPREPRGSPEANATNPPFKFPDLCIPGVPEKGDCCLWQIERRVDGKREAKYGNPYTCDMGPTRRGDMKIIMKLKFPGTPCDTQDIPPDNSTLEATGQVIRRDDQYAYFSGEFTIKSSAGKLLFEGTSRLRIAWDHITSFQTAKSAIRSRILKDGS